jgi:acetyl-CoA synthetase
MEQDMIFEPSADLAKSALIDADGYAALYQESIANPDQFWAEHGKRIDWIKPYSQISDVSYDAKDLHIKWYADGTLNAAANCLDRHLTTRGDQTAIIWEGDEPDQHRQITYRELHEDVCKFANVLKANGAKKRRPDHYLYANDPRSRRGHACLCSNWSRAFGCLWWLFARRACRPH